MAEMFFRQKKASLFVSNHPESRKQNQKRSKRERIKRKRMREREREGESERESERERERQIKERKGKEQGKYGSYEETFLRSIINLSHGSFFLLSKSFFLFSLLY